MADAELHLSSSQGKDHQVQALRYPIVELGEIDSTFRKADVSALKAFLSRQMDEIREPYARAATKHLRGTCFFGTVNDVEFLNDGTGTRRYWPVYITGPINWDHGIDLQQLWAQATSWWEKGDDWFLDDDQDKQRVAASEAFTMTSPIIDILSAHVHDHKEKWGEYVVANKTEILRLCGIAHPNMVQVADAARWLAANFGKHRKLKGKQRCWAVPGGDHRHLSPTVIGITDVEAKKYVKWKV
jgi:putative DNA primase/helicase